MGLFSNDKKARGRTDAVDVYRMKSTIEDIARDAINARPDGTQAYVLNQIHYEVGRGKYDVQAEREILATMDSGERDAWYQRIIAPMGIDRGLLMDSARKDMTDGEVQTLQRNFQEIVDFYERTGNTPKKDKTNPVEYSLGARLEALRSQPEKAQALAGMDNHKLLTRSDATTPKVGQTVFTKNNTEFEAIITAVNDNTVSLKYSDAYYYHEGSKKMTFDLPIDKLRPFDGDWEAPSWSIPNDIQNTDSKGTQLKNTLKQDGKTYLLKTDAYEKRFDSEPQAKLFAKRHNIEINLDAEEVRHIQSIKRNGERGSVTAVIKNGEIYNISLNANSGQSSLGLEHLADRMKKGFEENDTSKFVYLDAKEDPEKKEDEELDEDGKKPKDEPADKPKEDEELDEDGNPVKKKEEKKGEAKMDSLMPTFKAIRADESYNGFKNYETWNVSLWIANDYGLYQTAVEYAKSATNPTYRDFVGYAGLSGSTPDGVDWNDADLDYNALNQEFNEYRNDTERTDTERKDEYNGWANRETWNVSLWINNGLYQMAVEYMNEANNGNYRDFVAYAGLSGATPDGVSWTDGDLNYQELNSMMRELS